MVDFAGRRVDGLPSPFRLGVTAVAMLVRLLTVVGRDAAVRVLATRPLPLLGEYVRMLRSLGYAFVWERWPDTRPDGTPA